MVNYIHQITNSSIQIAAVSNGSFAHAKQITGYIASGYDSANKLYSGAHDDNWSELLKLSESVTLLVTSMFFSQVGGVIHDALEIRSGVADLMAGRNKNGITKISFSALSLVAQLTLNIHARIALVSATILFDLAHSIDSFRNERYIEGVGLLICAAIRVKKNRELLNRYKQIWETTQLERRVAIDAGSGSTKVIIADVDKSTNRIINVVHQSSIPMPYQKSLEDSKDGSFNSEIQKEGINTFQEIKKLAQQYQADKIYAVATSAFRTSNNGETFAKKISESTDIPVKIISQFEEGVLAYESLLNIPELPSKNYVCWDIGTGSLQITSPNEKGEYAVYMTKTGSVPFKNYIINDVKGEDPKKIDTPNPLDQSALKQASRYARWIGRHASPSIKSSIKQHDGSVVGIGRLFQNSLLPLAKGSEITRKDLRAYVRSALGKSDADLNNPFANVDVSNAILALGVMTALHVHKISVKESTSTNGMLTHKEYWESIT